MPKHAYLIMAHNEFNLLKKLILLLDDSRNDIFLHVDKKAKNFDKDQFIALAQYAKLVLVKQMSVSWGALSQIQCEINLLKEAIKTPHDYYHLLSGADLPIKSQDEIHAFFALQKNKEYIWFQKDAMKKNSFADRIQLFHPLQEWIGRKRKGSLLYQFNRGLLKLQGMIGIQRKKDVANTYKKGTTWFSITHNLAQHMVSLESAIRKSYRFTKCADEIFLHTAAWNSQFKGNIADNSLRHIDWKRGRPYTFTRDDFDELMMADAFWARKFSEEKDPVIIEMIYKHLRSD